MMKIFICILILILGTLLSSCKDYLDVKPDAQLAVPSDKLQYLQLLLDNTGTLNQFNPAAGDLASDDAYIPDVQWNALLQVQKTSANAYIWEKDMFNDSDVNDWSTPYRAVFYTNLVLDGLEKQRNESDTPQWKEIRGAALFYRSYAYFNLLQTFAKGYHSATSKTDRGIVLKSSSDINEKLSRAPVEECYALIITNCEEAKALLPKTAAYKTRPSAASAAGLLARVYLVMQQYDKALSNAEEALSANSVLIDYNSLNANASFPFKRFNEEVVFHSTITSLSGASAAYGRVSAGLYDLYQDNDLRRTVFYTINAGNIFFKGSYFGTNSRFNGIATDELYLIAAECYARNKNLPEAFNKLNSLLVKRWKTGTFVPLNAMNEGEALRIILEERRKELAFRNLRWSDLKRLNQEPALQRTITKVVNDKTYTLMPGDKRYAMPIPLKVIMASGIEQN
jgi:starch-binding outer membrane protein, SusD/RagB family